MSFSLNEQNYMKISRLNLSNLWSLIRLEMRVFFEEFNIYLGIAKTNGDITFLDPMLYPYKFYLTETIQNIKMAEGTFLIKTTPYLKKFIFFKVSQNLIYILYSTNNDISGLVRITNKLNEHSLIILKLIEIYEEIRFVLKQNKLFYFKRSSNKNIREFLKKKLDAMTNIFIENLKLKSVKRVLNYIEKLEVVAKNTNSTLLYYVLYKIEKHIKSKLDIFINLYINEERLKMVDEGKNEFIETMLKVYRCKKCYASFNNLVIADNLYYCKKCNYISSIF
ncbi:MAG: hypothetical protein EAX96_19750 [Candidatus Lokiarchaeota archaeon]|nr:hypothetical protein [Candidatus Lokiarchaeota archaeon]